MTEWELENRLHTEKIALPGGFDARQENALIRAMAAQKQSGGRYQWAIVLAAVITLFVATAAAAGYWGLAHFWRDASPDAVTLIESGIIQTGGRMDDAAFTVQEAVFDGRTLQAVLAIQATEGRFAVLEGQNDNVRSDRVRVDCWLDGIGGQKSHTGMTEGQVDENGMLNLYISETLDKAVDTDKVHVSLKCATMTADGNRWGNRHVGTLEFDLPRIVPETVEMDVSAELEGWLSVEHVCVSYTALGATLEIRYQPGVQLGEALPLFYVDSPNDTINNRYGGSVKREGNAQTGYLLTIQTGLPTSLPHRLTLGVRGLKSVITLDFDKNTAVVEGVDEE